jgi:hypothetical protein
VVFAFEDKAERVLLLLLVFGSLFEAEQGLAVFISFWLASLLVDDELVRVAKRC